MTALGFPWDTAPTAPTPDRRAGAAAFDAMKTDQLAHILTAATTLAPDETLQLAAHVRAIGVAGVAALVRADLPQSATMSRSGSTPATTR